MSGLSVCLRARALHRFVKALCSPLRFALIECGEACFDLEFQKSEYSLHELTVPVTSTLCCGSSSRWVLAVLSSRSDAAELVVKIQECAAKLICGVDAPALGWLVAKDHCCVSLSA